MIPRATYRLQFTKDFGFKAAASIGPYLAKLGVSHVYASPYLKARPGSTHGYDIINHVELNPELGSQADFLAMVDAFKANGLGQILDFVPNHMGVGGADNRWWLDVLEWGPQSEYAAWFDIDWRSGHEYLHDKLLVPFLGDHFGVVLENGDLQLKFDADEGAFAVWAYGSHKLPICPRHYGLIIGDGPGELERLGDAFSDLTDQHPQTMNRAKRLKEELSAVCCRDRQVVSEIGKALVGFRGQKGDLKTWERLNALIAKQSWRLAHFRVASDDINYRRFFNVNDLAGVRMEIPELFDHAHSLVFKLLENGTIDGIRLDHIDGLLDPKAYCLRIREKAPVPFYLLVEKILAPHERLRESWGVDGTTGYEFANLLTGLLTHPSGEKHLTDYYRTFTNSNTSFEDMVRNCKVQIMENEMASELGVLAHEAGRVARSNPRTADFTDNVLHRALREVVACFPVYRTYVDTNGAATEDRRDLDWAFSRARRENSHIEGSAFDFLYKLLSGDLVDAPQSGYRRASVFRMAMRTQQYSGPVMAKGLEDTAFYRYNRFLALNEVGGQPNKFSISIAAFHQSNMERAKRTPHAMLASSTHDTKRGEDARARLAVLSEIAEEWTQQVDLWHRILRPELADINSLSPDPNDEYAFYQMLLGSWPPELSHGSVPGQQALDAFRSRIEAAMIKAVREAKVHTTWSTPDQAYETAMLAFIRRALNVSVKNRFLESFVLFQERVALLGWRNSLVQLVLKLTAPGVPDIYQGAELWDVSMVDPDNRRPVDFEVRARSLCSDGALADLIENWRQGQIKQNITRKLLHLRAAVPDLFLNGSYQPLETGDADHTRVCCYLRSHDDTIVAVAVLLYPSLETTSERDGQEYFELPDRGPWRSLIDDRLFHGKSISFRDIFGALPVAVLVKNNAT